MSKGKKANRKVSTTEKIFDTLDSDAGKIQLFVDRNKNAVIYILSSLLSLIVLSVGYQKYYKEPLELEASEYMSSASAMFRMDSIDLALNGYGDELGFLDISEEYGITKAGNLANYYCGVIYMKKGEFDNAIEQLSDFSSDDKIISPMAKGLIGDCFMELEQYEDAVKYYKEASDENDNEITTPMYLMKAGKVSMLFLKDNKRALSFFEKIKKDFPKTTEGNNIDKYIARVKN